MVLVFQCCMLFLCHQESTQYNIVSVFGNFLKDHVGVPKLFCQMVPELKNFFNLSKIPSALVPGIKNDYSLKPRDSCLFQKNGTKDFEKIM